MATASWNTVLAYTSKEDSPPLTHIKWRLASVKADLFSPIFTECALAVNVPATDTTVPFAPRFKVSGKPTVTVPFVRLTSTSFAVPLTARTAPVVASLRVTSPEETSKSPESKLATPLFDVEASSPDIEMFPLSVCVTSIPSPPANVNVCELAVNVPVSVVTFLSTESSSSTAPDVTLKSAVAKLATPLLVVVASSPDIEIVLAESVISIPSPSLTFNKVPKPTSILEPVPFVPSSI